MHIFVTGATGFVGNALLAELRRRGHSIAAWVRDVDRARATLESGTQLVPTDDDDALRAAVAAADAVVNLAGAPVIGRRWTPEVKRQLVASRVDLTQRLVDAMRASPTPPRALVSASAVGIYGTRGDAVLDEDAAPADGFLARLCVDWEAAAQQADDVARVAILRIGLVLGLEGGMLGSLEPLFRAGLGGRLGDGRHYQPWIHLDDLVRMIAFAVESPNVRGVFNATGPEPVTNRDLTAALADALDKPALLPAPRPALRLLLGEASSVLFASQRAVPRRAIDAGFGYRFPTLEDALADLYPTEVPTRIGPADEAPESPYLARRRPTYMLESVVPVDRPVDEVFAFFSEADNLGMLTPPALQWSITERPEGGIATGARLAYRIKLGPFPMRWGTLIERFEPESRFVDAQMSGPYRCWWHEHRFEERGDATVMVDRVWYAPPLGIVGRLANALFIRRMLRRIFEYRRFVVERRFGRASLPAPAE